MLHKTRGIVLNYIKYSESSIIIHVYTELFGLQSYIINGIRSARSKRSIGFFQPLTLLDMVVYHHSGNKISRISEYKIAHAYTSIPFDVKKSTIAIFLTEFLLRVIKEDEDHDKQFDFVFKSFELLDTMATGFQDFHLIFIIKLSRYLGIGIVSAEDLLSHTPIQPTSTHIDAYIDALIVANYKDPLHANGVMRKETLDLLMAYFEAHYGTWQPLKSLKIFSEVFH